jgi:hypothetical protein
MRRVVREVTLFAAIASTMNLLPACGSEFIDADSNGGGGNGGTGGSSSVGAKAAGGSGGSKTITGAGTAGMGPVSGAGGSQPSPGTAGTSGEGGGEGGTAPIANGGAGGSDTGNECEVELLTNGGFDALSPGWTEMAAPARALILHQSSDVVIALQDVPVSPEYMLVLGGANDDDSRVSQAISVPDAALSLLIRFYQHIHTEEVDPQTYDSLTLGFSTGAAETTPIASYTNLHENEDWEPVSLVLDAAPYRGTNLTFTLHSDADGMADTIFMLDSFSITADVCE